MLSALILSIFISSNLNCKQLCCNQTDSINSCTKSLLVMAPYYGRETPGTFQGADPQQGEDDQAYNNYLKKQAPNGSPLDRKPMSDLIPKDPSPLLDGWLRTNEKTILLADRWQSLHPEHDRNSPSYSGRRGPGPDHGDDPHGDDPHDEVHDYALPANEGRDHNHPYGGNYPTKDPYGGTVPR